MVCYDLDRFRRFVFDSSFSRKFNLDAAEMERAKTDDEALQALGFRWLRFCLFGEETFEIRGDLKEILGKHLGVGRGDKPVSPGNGKKDSTG